MLFFTALSMSTPTGPSAPDTQRLRSLPTKQTRGRVNYYSGPLIWAPLIGKQSSIAQKLVSVRASLYNCIASLQEMLGYLGNAEVRTY